ncbi:MAG: iron ABC transporter permease [Firmicutes bacterium]|nr:iron ABC transporter permease [Bacillota bacterium]
MEKKRTVICMRGFLLLIFIMGILVIMNIGMGSSSIGIFDAVRILFDGGKNDTAGRIIMDIRLPRTLAAMMLGGALSVSGFLLQSFFRNPIAGPFVLGISSGAKLTVAFVMISALKGGYSIGSGIMVTAAFIGSSLSTIFILIMSGKVKNMAQLIISGVMIGYICSAATEIMVNFADDANIVNLHNWSMGSFSAVSMADIRVIFFIVGICFVFSVMLSKRISAYQLGEAYAENMGVNIRSFRVMLIMISSMLSACVTAFAGPVSFVGVAVPHLMKALFNTAKPIVIIPASFLGGGCFCLLCDLLARMMFAPRELSISTVTAVFGAPIVIWIMIKSRKRND